MLRTTKQLPDLPFVVFWHSTSGKKPKNRHGLDHFPQNASMYSSLANVELKAGHRNEAILWLQQRLAGVRSDQKLLWYLANLLIDEGRVTEAEAPLQQLRTLKYPQPLLAYLDSGIQIAKSQRFDASKQLETIRPALVQWPELTQHADLKLGQCYEALGRPDPQPAAFRRAAGADPDWVAARLGVALALLSTFPRENLAKRSMSTVTATTIGSLAGALLGGLNRFSRVGINDWIYGENRGRCRCGCSPVD